MGDNRTSSNHSPLFESAMNAELERLRRESASRYEHPLAMKLLASVGSVRPEPFVRVYERAPRSMPGSITAVGAGLTNEFMSALGRDLWRRQYAMEREAFEPWIDFGGES